MKIKVTFTRRNQKLRRKASELASDNNSEEDEEELTLKKRKLTLESGNFKKEQEKEETTSEDEEDSDEEESDQDEEAEEKEEDQSMTRNIELRNIIQWGLQHYKNSCRYSTFFTLYKFQLIHLDSSFCQKNKNSENVFLNKIIATIQLMKKDAKKAFEKFSQFNKKNMFEVDEFGAFGSITNIFRAFHCLKSCCLIVRDEKICSHCTFRKTRGDCKIGPLFGLDEKSLKLLGIQNSILSYLEPLRWSCDLCGRLSSILTQREVTSLPSLLIVVLDLTDRSLELFSRYQNSLIIKSREFRLISAIIKPTANHFALLIKDPRKDKRSKKMYGWYKYDDLANNGDILPIDGEIEQLLKAYHGYILLYKIVPE